MTSSNGNIFCVTGLLCGEFTGNRWIPRTKASDAKLWSFLWSTTEPTVEQTTETPVIWDATALIMTSLQYVVFVCTSLSVDPLAMPSRAIAFNTSSMLCNKLEYTSCLYDIRSPSVNPLQWIILRKIKQSMAATILGMGSANKRRCYIVTLSLIGWAHKVIFHRGRISFTWSLYDAMEVLSTILVLFEGNPTPLFCFMVVCLNRLLNKQSSCRLLEHFFMPAQEKTPKLPIIGLLRGVSTCRRKGPILQEAFSCPASLWMKADESVDNYHHSNTVQYIKPYAKLQVNLQNRDTVIHSRGFETSRDVLQ